MNARDTAARNPRCSERSIDFRKCAMCRFLTPETGLEPGDLRIMIPLTEDTWATKPCKRALLLGAVMPEKARFRGRSGRTRGQSVVILQRPISAFGTRGSNASAAQRSPIRDGDQALMALDFVTESHMTSSWRANP